MVAVAEAPTVPDMLAIAPVTVHFEGETEPRDFYSSNQLLRALLAPSRPRVLAMTDDGRAIDSGSLWALNAYIRHGEGRLQWQRVRCPGRWTRWGWAGFKDHLGLSFR